MTARFQMAVAALFCLPLIFDQPAFAKKEDVGGKKATVEQLETEATARQDADEALQVQIDNISLTPGPKGGKGDPGEPGLDAPDRTAELCALYQHLLDNDVLGSLAVPDYCPEPQFCTADVKQCPDGSILSRDPFSDCQFPDCPSDFAFCGGIAGIACPGGFSCEDDPRDNCDPEQGGADCGGICTDDNLGNVCATEDDMLLYQDETFFDGCNTCICGSDGTFVCTEKICLP